MDVKRRFCANGQTAMDLTTTKICNVSGLKIEGMWDVIIFKSGNSGSDNSRNSYAALSSKRIHADPGAIL